MSTKEQYQSHQETILQAEGSLVLFNDHENTFNFVIDVLCTVCEHTEEQAEQCAWITHYKGKCQVMTGNIDELQHKASLMSEAGLTVEVQ